MDKRVMKDINNLFDFVHYANSLGACLAGIYNVPYLLHTAIFHSAVCPHRF